VLPRLRTVPRPHRDHTSSAFSGVYGRDNRVVEPKRLAYAAPAFPRGEPPRCRHDAGRILGDDEAVGRDVSRETGVGARVVAVDAAAEDCDRTTADLEAAAVRAAIDAARKAGDDDNTGACEVAAERAGDCAP